jgi:uncharacterized protein (TIGR04255 family)
MLRQATRIVSKNRPELPDFEAPPVTEVVLSVQFEVIGAFQVQHIGLLWERFRSRFPKVETHPPLDPAYETFPTAPQKPTVRFELAPAVFVPRVWFVNATGTELVQIQQDRLVHNWRKVGTGASYPRFEHVQDQFHQDLSDFQSFLEEHSLGVLKPNQCEVTYINRIETNSVWSSHGDAGRVLKDLAKNLGTPHLSTPEALRLSSRYVIRDSDTDSGKPIGRLHVEFFPAFHASTSKPIFVLNLTARGAPIENADLEGVFRFMERGRALIVHGFAELTTSEMHHSWGRKDNA